MSIEIFILVPLHIILFTFSYIALTTLLLDIILEHIGLIKPF